MTRKKNKIMTQFEKRISIFSILAILFYGISLYVNPSVSSVGGDPIMRSIIHATSLRIFHALELIILFLIITHFFKKRA